IGNTDFRAACRPRSSRRAGSLSACRNSRYESTWMASRNGTSRIERRLPKSLRMRFFSVNEYDVVMGSYRLWHLWAARPRPGGNQGTASWKSLVLPAPARLLPLFPTADSCRSSGQISTTAEGRGLPPPASVVADDTGDATTLT